jgi:transcription termination/antitermination protein NusG
MARRRRDDANSHSERCDGPKGAKPVSEPAVLDSALVDAPAAVTPAAAWYVLWTRSHCESLVADQLAAKGFRAFLPTVEVWARRAGERRRCRVPMFPGYVFLRHALDKWSDVEVRKARGVVTILGDAWDRRAVVPDGEMTAIERLVASRLPAAAHGHLREGQRVRIVGGPMDDVEGILVRTKPGKGLLVLSIALLHRSVAVEVDCTMVRPV